MFKLNEINVVLRTRLKTLAIILGSTPDTSSFEDGARRVRSACEEHGSAWFGG